MLKEELRHNFYKWLEYKFCSSNPEYSQYFKTWIKNITTEQLKGYYKQFQHESNIRL